MMFLEFIIPLIWVGGILGAIWIIPYYHDKRFHPEYFFPAAGCLGLFFYGLGLFGFLYSALSVIVTGALGIYLVKALLVSRIDRHFAQFIKTHRIVSGLLGVAFIWFALASLSYPVTPDALYFHLGLPKLYAKGGMAFFTPGNLFSAAPRTMEMISTAFFSLGLERAAQFFIFLVAVVFIFTVWFKAREFGGSGFYSVLLIFTVPIFVSQLTASKNDYLLWGLSFFAALKYLEFAKTGKTTELLWSAVGAGMAAGTKAIGLALYGAFAIVIIYNYILGTERLKHLFYFTFFFVLFSAPWYMYSWITTGNPFFPFFNSIFPSPYTMPAFETFNRGIAVRTVDHNLWELIRSPFDLIFNPERYDGRLGFALLAFPAMLLFVKRVPRAVKLAIGISLAYYMIWFFGFSYARFLLPMISLLAIAGSYFAARAIGNGGYLKIVIAAVLAVALFLPVLPALRDSVGRVDSVIMGTPKYQFLRSYAALDPYNTKSAEPVPQLPYIDCWQKLNTDTPPDAKVGILTSFTTRADAYYLERDFIYLNPSEQKQYDFTNLRSEEQINSSLNKLGLSYIVLDSVVLEQFAPESPWAKLPEFELFSAGVDSLKSYCALHGEVVFKDNRYTAYHI